MSSTTGKFIQQAFPISYPKIQRKLKRRKKRFTRVAGFEPHPPGIVSCLKILFILSDCFFSDSDYDSYDLTPLNGISSLYDCNSACQNNAKCVVYTYKSADQYCLLKQGHSVDTSSFPGTIAASRWCDGKASVVDSCPISRSNFA